MAKSKASGDYDTKSKFSIESTKNGNEVSLLYRLMICFLSFINKKSRDVKLKFKQKKRNLINQLVPLRKSSCFLQISNYPLMGNNNSLNESIQRKNTLLHKTKNFINFYKRLSLNAIKSHAKSNKSSYSPMEKMNVTRRESIRNLLMIRKIKCINTCFY
eukprot:TRINITY_DN11000_c0_g1_i1.p1 TRINITY_DN11000_c0_g1~~TRINITY_DN11000_c0_g1_i1.p1  ORF type:complete len:159 (+),score=1.71 TRINITY_DN11000_c0_g1_i1:381-857(+)